VVNSDVRNVNASPIEVSAIAGGVAVRSRRNPDRPALAFSDREWRDLLRTLACGRLPAYAEELADGHLITFAPTGQEDRALTLRLDEVDTLTSLARKGVFGPAGQP